jgi:hypothetical protein
MIHQALPVLLIALGLILELLGVVRMAWRYVQVVPPREIPRLLAGALLDSPAARQAARLNRQFAENTLDSLQGLGLIALGFLSQTLGTAITLFTGSSGS